MTAFPEKRILLIIGGGIAAYKALELIRRLRERGFFRARGDDGSSAAVRDKTLRRKLDRQQGVRRTLRADR